MTKIVMNKIKVLYDIVKAMQAKEVWRGVMNVQVLDGEERLWDMTNEFLRNSATGLHRAKVKTELAWGGKNLSHESTTEFRKVLDCRSPHCYHHRHVHGKRIWEGESKLHFLGLLLKTLNDMTITEDNNGCKMLTVEVTEFPSEMKAKWCKMLEHTEQEHKHHRFLTEYLPLSDVALSLKLSVNKDNEVENVLVTLVGSTAKGGETRELKLRGEITLGDKSEAD